MQLLERREQPAASAPRAAPASRDGTGDETALRCRVCEAVVASARDRVERFGAHAHERVNPSGFTFVIGCFSRADGVLGVGDESDEFPWFPRHRWRCVVCASCGTHLGWHFRQGGNEFIGLILARLLD